MVSKKETDEIKKAVSGKEPQLTDLPGIGPAVAAKLESAGIYDLMTLAVMSPATLADTVGVGAAVARKAIQASRKLLDLGFQDGMEFAQRRANVCYITTGSKNLDELLGGKGVESRSITEAFGASHGTLRVYGKLDPRHYGPSYRMQHIRGRAQLCTQKLQRGFAGSGGE